MDEKNWQECADPYEMLEFLTTPPQGQTLSCQRKLLLLCCACCRRLWRQLTREQRVRIESAERSADGSLAEDFAKKPFHFRRWGPHGTTIDSILAAAVEETCENRGTCLCYAASAMSLQAVPPDLSWRTAEYRAARNAELTVQAALVRDLFGNPFRPPPPIEKVWLSWHNEVVRQLVRCIYGERDFGRLPVLADALEEAGCTDAEILNHCRGPGPHARGCWVLDILLDFRDNSGRKSRQPFSKIATAPVR